MSAFISRARCASPAHQPAFTLAEVLITLGIIGIVAAMTIPALVNKYEKKQTSVRVKKVYSELTQAIRLSEAENGDFEDWSIDENLYYTIEGTKIYVDRYIRPYYKSLKICGKGDSNENTCGAAPVSHAGVQYVTNNGTAISIVYTGKAGLNILVDLEPKKEDKILGRNVFYFDTINYKKRIMPSGWKKDLTREMALTGYDADGYRYSCKKIKTNEDDIYTDFRHSCTALLMIDGWEIKNDYPW